MPDDAKSTLDQLKLPLEAKETWLTRPAADGDGVEVNLQADATAMVPLTQGEIVGAVTIRETRMYSIQELRELTQPLTQHLGPPHLTGDDRVQPERRVSRFDQR